MGYANDVRLKFMDKIYADQTRIKHKYHDNDNPSKRLIVVFWLNLQYRLIVKHIDLKSRSNNQFDI